VLGEVVAITGLAAVVWGLARATTIDHILRDAVRGIAEATGLTPLTDSPCKPWGPA
jgi:hypothetical protein